MKALVTGFEAWAGHVNPSGMIAKQLHGRKISSLEVVGIELPEDFHAIPGLARKALKEVKPDAVLSMGWDYTRVIRAEKVALNIMSSVFGDKIVPDNSGNKPRDQPVVRGAPLAYRATLPVNKIVNSLTSAGIPAAISFSAGTHCCNTTMFSFLHATRVTPGVISGFIHIPPIPSMVKGKQRIFTMPLSTETRAAEIALKACAEYLSSKRDK